MKNLRSDIKTGTVAAAIAVAAAAFCSCTHNDDPAPGNGDNAIAFSSAIGSLTRADDLLKDRYTSFRVWMGKSDNAELTSMQAVMPGYVVTYDGTAAAWDYVAGSQLLKYWDASAADYVIYACAPSDAAASVDSDGVRISGVTGHLAKGATGTIDWLIADHVRHLEDGTVRARTDEDRLDATNWKLQDLDGNLFSSVPLRFHAPLAQVEFRIYNVSYNEGDPPVKLESFSVTTNKALATEGNLKYTPAGGVEVENLNTATNTYTAIASCSPDLGITAKTRDKALRVGDVMLEMPQSFGGTDEQMDVTIRVTIDGHVTTTAPLSLEGGWLPGMKYIYYVRLDQGTDIIYIDLDFDAWERGGDVEIDDPFNNW